MIQVMVDLEHFFDGCTASGMRGEGEYANLCLRTAAAAGATTIVLCDTNGGAMPWIVEERTARAVEAVAEWPNVQIGIHCHNDTGLAVANSLCAVRAGAKLVQGCINGYGERTGNADLITVIGDLQVRNIHSIHNIHSIRSILISIVSFVDALIVCIKCLT
jgi:2-isopropylmalate synthase